MCVYFVFVIDVLVISLDWLKIIVIIGWFSEIVFVFSDNLCEGRV